MGLRSPNLTSPGAGLKSPKAAARITRIATQGAENNAENAITSPSKTTKRRTKSNVALMTPPPRSSSVAIEQATSEQVMSSSSPMTALTTESEVINAKQGADPSNNGAEGESAVAIAVSAVSAAVSTPAPEEAAENTGVEGVSGGEQAESYSAHSQAALSARLPQGRQYGFVTISRSARVLGRTASVPAAIMRHAAATVTGAGTPGDATAAASVDGPAATGTARSPLFASVTSAGRHVSFADPFTIAGWASVNLSSTTAQHAAAPSPAAAAEGSDTLAVPAMAATPGAVSEAGTGRMEAASYIGSPVPSTTGPPSASRMELGAGLSPNARAQYLTAKVCALETELYHTRLAAGTAADTAATGFAAAQSLSQAAATRAKRITADLTSRLSALSKQLEEAQAHNSSLASENSALQARVDKLTTSRANMRVEMAELYVQLQAKGGSDGSSSSKAGHVELAEVAVQAEPPFEAAASAICPAEQATTTAPPEAAPVQAVPTSELSDFASSLVVNNAQLLQTVASLQDANHVMGIEVQG